MGKFSQTPIAAAASQMSWFAGLWIGSHDADHIEEHWSSADAESLIGMFRLIRDGKIVFMEFLAIETEGTGLVMRIKHFYPGLKGWEEKDACVELDLVQLDGSRSIWSKRGDEVGKWLIYERSGDQMQAWFEKPSQEPGVAEKFEYRLSATTD